MSSSNSVFKMKCHYEVMELERSASTDEIKRQYKKMALKYHPDRNIGDEETATEAFKLVSSAYSVLSDPQERQWYDDHRESILRGGNGTKSSDDDDSEEYVVNLWKFFNSSCYDGFNDSDKGFFAVYRNVFHQVWEQEAFSSTKQEPEVSFGKAVSSNAEVLSFYNYWTHYSSCRNFSWEDKYNVSDAPNRHVRRAVDKENQKYRDTAKKAFNNLVHSLVKYIRKRDPRIVAIEAEISRKAVEEQQKRLQLREEGKAKRRELKELNRALYENDVEEQSKRATERQQAFLLADNSDEEDVLYGKSAKHDDDSENGATLDFDGYDIDEQEKILQGLLLESKEGKQMEEVDRAESEEEEEELFRCDVCQKDFRAESQLEQHLSSKVHRKKVQETQKKSGSKGRKGSSKIDMSMLDETDSDVLDLGDTITPPSSSSSSKGKKDDSSKPEAESAPTSTCRECGWTGQTRNQLFEHIRESGHGKITAPAAAAEDGTASGKKSKRKVGLK